MGSANDSEFFPGYPVISPQIPPQYVHQPAPLFEQLFPPNRMPSDQQRSHEK